MKAHEYAQFDAIGLRELIATGEVSSTEVETAARSALDTVNAQVNGLALPVFTPALEHADDGPLTGVPFLIKDAGPVARGVPFFLGSRSLPGIVPEHDSELMTRFRAAGLVTLGLTTTPEMAISFATESVKYGITRNPWDLSRGSGGSSGGAAALVASGAVPVAHCTDGAGSIRIPASCCGLVGLKPSRGRTPCGPDSGDPAFGMSYAFGLTRTVRDAAHYLDAVQGPGIGDKYTAPPPLRAYAEELGADQEPLRIALTVEAWSGVPVDQEVADATVRVGRMLEEMGHLVTQESPVIDTDTVLECTHLEIAAIAAPFLQAPRPPDPAKLEAVSRQVVTEGRALGALEIMAGMDAQNRLTRSLGAFLDRYDLLVTPTMAQLPAPHGTLQYDNPDHTVTSWLQEIFTYGPFTMAFNASGQPALSLPLGHSQERLPIGVQLVAPYGREDVLFRIAARLENAMPWRERMPPCHVANTVLVTTPEGSGDFGDNTLKKMRKR